MLLLPPSKPSAQSSLLIGVPLASRLVSTTNHQLSYPTVTWPRFLVLYACCLTPLLLLKLGLVLTTSSILCMPSVPLFTGMWEKVWRKENSLRPVKIWLLLRKIMKRLVLTAMMVLKKKVMIIRHHIIIIL